MSGGVFRYRVVVDTGVSIGPRSYADVIDLTSPDPAEAIRQALAAIAKRDPDNQLWQSDDVRITCERTA